MTQFVSRHMLHFKLSVERFNFGFVLFEGVQQGRIEPKSREAVVENQPQAPILFRIGSPELGAVLEGCGDLIAVEAAPEPASSAA